MRRPTKGVQFNPLDLGVETQPGVDLFVDTVSGKAGATGLSWDAALSTVEEAVGRLAAPKFFSAQFAKNASIYIIGDVREQFTAPSQLAGVRLVGAAKGRPRYSTSGGVVVDGNGCSWREKASAGAVPLLKVQGQGWEFENIQFVPQSGHSAVQLYRDAVIDPKDASHARFIRCRFAQGGQVGYGLEDNGGAYHIEVTECEFLALEYAWKQTSVGVDAPTAHIWRRNIFDGCKTDIAMNAKNCLFEGNYFRTPYDVTTHPTTLNLIATADAGVATAKNVVKDNVFADATANVVIAKGYKAATGDIWRNYVTDSADAIVALPG